MHRFYSFPEDSTGLHRWKEQERVLSFLSSTQGGGPCPSSINITWELVRKADSQVPPRTCWIRLLILTESPGDSCVHPIGGIPVYSTEPNLALYQNPLKRLKKFLDLIPISLNRNHHGWPRDWYFVPSFICKCSNIEKRCTHTPRFYDCQDFDMFASSHTCARIYPSTYFTFSTHVKVNSRHPAPSSLNTSFTHIINF